MTFSDFAARVQERAQIASAAEAEHVLRASLRVLGQLLSQSAAAHLSGRLPPEAAACLAEAAPDASIDLAEFFERVSLRTGRDLPEAVHTARAVVGALCDSLDAPALEALRASLPAGFDVLFECLEQAQPPAL